MKSAVSREGNAATSPDRERPSAEFAIRAHAIQFTRHLILKRRTPIFSPLFPERKAEAGYKVYARLFRVPVFSSKGGFAYDKTRKRWSNSVPVVMTLFAEQAANSHGLTRVLQRVLADGWQDNLTSVLEAWPGSRVDCARGTDRKLSKHETIKPALHLARHEFQVYVCERAFTVKRDCN